MQRRPRKEADKVACALALTPGGSVVLEGSPPADSLVEVATVDRVRAAFVGGSGAGLYHLGAVEATSELPPTCAYWRDFGRLFMTRLCALPALDEHRDSFELPCPVEELPGLLLGAPPMTGSEYLSAEILERLWSEMQAAARAEMAAFAGDVDEYLHAKNPVWNHVGRVHFHLAEQAGDDARPFAFVATYTARLGAGGKTQHVQLGKALEEYAGPGNKSALLSLLRPVQAAAIDSELLRELVDSNRIFRPLAWTPAEAHRFLHDVPIFEAAGVVVRVPDWWKTRSARRPQVQVTVGRQTPSRLGLDALLDFSVRLVVDGEPLDDAEVEELLAGSDGLVSIKGHWVELDRHRLEQVLGHWRGAKAAAREGLSFAEAMRVLAGATLDPGSVAPDADDPEPWSSRIAGPWLAQVLDDLTRPEILDALEPGGDLKTKLRPYQEIGVRWLRRLQKLGMGALLADDMGLGKTIQVLALLLLRKRERPATPSLLVVPASLIANWTAEIDRFTPSLTALVAHPSARPAAELRALDTAELCRHDVVITSFGYVARLPWASQLDWDVLVADEAQALKNPSAQQTRAIKELRSRTRIALTGTPVENRLTDLWSLFDFINPGLLGSATAFKRFANHLADRERDKYGPLHELTRPYLLRRLKTDRRIMADLPDKTEVIAHCSLSKVQAALYQQSVELLSKQLKKLDGIQRRGVVLAFLTRFKQICNHPSHWLGDGAYAPADSGKFARLREICEEIAARQEKVLVFTQYREITEPLAAFLGDVFGRPGLVLSGSTPVSKRRGLVDRFQDDEASPFFVLSLKAGGTGLNLTAASHVIHFDRWWNPAVENQATDRAFRIGQQRNVLVHKFVCRGTVEEKIDAIIRDKQALAEELVGGGGEALLTEMSSDELIRMVSLDVTSALAES